MLAVCASVCVCVCVWYFFVCLFGEDVKRGAAINLNEVEYMNNVRDDEYYDVCYAHTMICFLKLEDSFIDI
jgi:hypothetical protein